jgi:hypothetical protein
MTVISLCVDDKLHWLTNFYFRRNKHKTGVFFFSFHHGIGTPELEFLNIFGAQESIPRNQFRQPCSLAGLYNNPIPTRFLAPKDCLKIPPLGFFFFQPWNWNPSTPPPPPPPPPPTPPTPTPNHEEWFPAFW